MTGGGCPEGMLARVRQRLSPLPSHLAVFDRLVDRLSTRMDVSLGVSGSLASGPVDRWSDLDLEIVVHDPAALPAVHAWVAEAAGAAAPLLSRFAADHVGLDRILVHFFVEDATLVKADLYTLTIAEYRMLPEACLIRDPGDRVARAIAGTTPEVASPDYRDLDQKLCGWLWYIHSKIERGEALEAVNALETLRAKALAPLLRGLAGLPQEGCRRLETGLPRELLAGLNRTVPGGPDRDALRRALAETGRFYLGVRPALATALGFPEDDRPLRRMLDLVTTGSGAAAGGADPILRLPVIERAEGHLGAVVLEPDAQVCELVEALRAGHPVAGAVADPPHLTLLFLGRVSGARLLALHAALLVADPGAFEAEIVGIGRFGDGDTVTNLHLRLAPAPALAAAHDRLLRRARRFAWFDPGAYAGAAFTPHISIYDGVRLAPGDAAPLLAAAIPPDLRVRLGGAQIRAVALGDRGMRG